MPLSARGEEQAQTLAARMAVEALSEIHTSPRERARATADAIALQTGAPVQVVDALDEIDFGDWTGLPFTDLHGPQWDDWNARRATARTPNGESMEEATARIATHVETLARDRGGEAIALVTHADMIRGLVARVLGLSLDNLLRFEIDPASQSRLLAGPWGARVLSLNETVRTPA